MGASRLFATVLLAPALVVACNGLSGIGDLIAEEDASAIDVPETGSNIPIDPIDDAGTGLNPIDAPIPAPPPTCSCMPGAPAGWSALSLLLTVNGATPSGCPTGLSAAMTAGTDPKGSGCSPCACGAVTGACTTAMLQAALNTCSTPCGAIGGSSAPKPVTSNCSPVSYCGPSSAASAFMAPDAGSCPATGGTRGASAFDNSATACTFASPPAGSCATGEVCAPKSEGAPNAPVCVVRTGDNACPAGVYSEKSLFYGSVDDQRSCSSCACSAPNTTCTSATIAIYTGATCTTQVHQVTTAGNACATFSVQNATGSAKITAPSVLITNTGCAASGGTLSGALLGKNPTTVCCTK